MPDVIMGAQGGYTTVGGVVDATAKTSIQAQVDKFLALIADPDNSDGSAAHTDFDGIDGVMATLIRTEITALMVAVDAAAEA